MIASVWCLREISNKIVLGQGWTSARSKAGALGIEHEPLLRSRLMEREKKWLEKFNELIKIRILSNLLSGVALHIVARDP